MCEDWPANPHFGVFCRKTGAQLMYQSMSETSSNAARQGNLKLLELHTLQHRVVCWLEPVEIR